MIKLKDILLEIENSNFEYAYHAGPFKLTVNMIQFDKGAMGFHVGTFDQAEWVRTKTKHGFGGKISKFKVYHTTNNLYMDTIETDMAWEHADLLLLELLTAGMINDSDAVALADKWNINDYDFYEGNYYLYLNKASRMFGREYFPADDIGYNLTSEFYKNKEKLSDIRQMLIEHGYGAIKYQNNVEGTKSDKSICILDKSMIEDA